MRVLVIAACCLYENSSANLCHRAYIHGLVDSGYDVDLLSFSKNDATIDESIILPNINVNYEYDGISLYEKLSKKMGSNTRFSNSDTTEDIPGKISLKSKVFSFFKTLFRNSYGIYNPSITWYKHAKHFKSDCEYDWVISLAYPPVSHLVAKKLIESGRVICKKWTEIWEDPWTFELYNAGGHNNSNYFKRCYNAENSLLMACKDIVYVSPLTLKVQQEKFPESAGNMRWLPLPTYFTPELVEYENSENHYGYFGDYPPSVRNLEPFYNVAVDKNIYLDICGSPYGLFIEKANVSISPRLPLGELKQHEDNVNILVCLFNLGGGQIPGKIYQYAATNKVIIAVLDGTEKEKEIIRDYFSKYNRFIFCENSEESISNTIDILEKGDYSNISHEPLDVFSPIEIVKLLKNNGAI